VSVAEVAAEAPVNTAPKRIFGEITRQSMEDNAQLARLVMKLVQDACAKSAKRFGSLTVNDVASGLVSGRFRLWGVMEAKDATLKCIAVSEVRDGVFDIRTVGPDIEDMAEFLPMFESIARGGHCERVAITGVPRFRPFLGRGWFEREIRFERMVNVPAS
jgi:hypothetical protein